MTERYSIIFSLEENLYCSGAPLIIRAGRMMRDSYTGKLLAQIKYQNISQNKIKSVTVSLKPIDSAGRAMPDPVIYKYTDLSAERDGEFGQKTAVVLPDDNDIQTFEISVQEAVFEDGSCWNPEKSEWKALKAQKTLSESFQDEELATQYQIRYGSNCLYEPADDMGLWFCTCGAVNSMEERGCHSCRRVYSALKEVNVSSLKKECEQRLETEKEQSQKAEAENLEKRKSLKSKALILVPVLVVLILVAIFVPRELKRSKEYEAAQSLAESGQYNEASDAFAALGDYKDSGVQAESNVPYAETLDLMRYAETENPIGLKIIGVTESSLGEDDDISIILYEAAAERFEALGDYKDSKQLHDDCLKAIEDIKLAKLQEQYDAAKAMLADKQYLLARDAFLELGSFGDSRNMAKEAIYQKALSLYGFMSQRNVRDVYALLSTKTGEPGKISFSKEFALANGEGYITEFKAACGKDNFDFLLEDTPSENLLPFKDALSGLFKSLGNYKDSAEYLPQITELSDYTREFYALVESGDVFGAFDWLSNYEYEFENKDEWLRLLELYKPYCCDWALNSGDSSLIPYIAGKSNSGTNVCTAFTTKVVLGDGIATLKLSSSDGQYNVDFTTELGNAKGFSRSIEPFNYFVSITQFDRLAIIKYDAGGKALSSCDYSRAY